MFEEAGALVLGCADNELPNRDKRPVTVKGWRHLARAMARTKELVELLVASPPDGAASAFGAPLRALDARLRLEYPEEHRRLALIAALNYLAGERRGFYVIVPALRHLPKEVTRRWGLTPDLERRLWKTWDWLEGRMPEDSVTYDDPDDILDAIEDQQRRYASSPTLNVARNAQLRSDVSAELKGHRNRGGRLPGSRNQRRLKQVAHVRRLYRELDVEERRRALAGTSYVLRRKVVAELGVSLRTASRLIREALEQELGAVTVALARR